jgi:capsular exopolysaccharide synthesis family protein
VPSSQYVNEDLPRGLPQAMPLRHLSKPFLVEEVRAEHLQRIVFHSNPTSAAADKFRLLRVRMRELWTAGKLKSVLVTSPLPGDGKSTTAVNLATALTEEGTRKVLFVDADLHRGSLYKQLHLEARAGLAECLQGGLNPLPLIRLIEPLGWYLLSSGKEIPANPTELLKPQMLASLFQKLSSNFDWIVIDSPPILALSDAVPLRQHADGSLLVAKSGCTPVKAVEDALALLGRKHVIGLVLNGVHSMHQPYSSHHERYNRRAGSSPIASASDQP